MTPTPPQFERARRWLLLVGLVLIVVAAMLVHELVRIAHEPPPSHRPRGLLSVPTNQLTGLSPDVCNSTGITVAGGAVRDTVITNTTCGSWQLPTASTCPITGDPLLNAQTGLDANGKCATSGGSSITTYQIPVTPGRATFKFSWRSEAEPRGEATVVASAYDAGGSPINSWSCPAACNNQFWSDGIVSSKAAIWEETPEYFTIPAGVSKITLQVVRFLANTNPVSKVWVDDLYFYQGDFVHEQDVPAKTAFTGTRETISATGAWQRRNNAGVLQDWFPFCIATSPHRGTDWSIYAHNGFNCAWSIPTTALQNLYWNGSGYSATDWSSTGPTPPAIAKRAVDSEFAPEGMCITVDTQTAVRGQGVPWTTSDVTNLSAAIDNLYANGWGNQVCGWERDAEDNQDKYQRMQSVAALVDTRDKANNSGVRAHPIVTNVGLPGHARAFTTAAGALLTDMVGAYSGNLGPQRQLQEMAGLTAPAGYCQLQSGLGISFRAIVYRCLGEGGHRIGFWADNAQSGCVGDACAGGAGHGYGSYPLDAVDGSGQPREPWFAGGDGPRIAREINQLLPVLKTALPTDWSASSSNSNVGAWARSYGGEAHVFLANFSTTTQTTTITLAGVGGATTSNLRNYFTGATVTPDAATSSTITITLPPAGLATSTGVGGGTLVLRLVGSAVTGATTTTLAGTTTTTTPPTTINEHVYSVSLPTPSVTSESGAAVEAGVRVNVSCTGEFTGVWWYRPAGDTGAIVASVWDSNSKLVAQKKITDPISPTFATTPVVAAGPGWRFVPFDYPLTVMTGQSFIVGIYHPNGAYAYNYNGFTGRSLSSPSGCLTLPASGGAGAKNSLYEYGAAPAIPTQSYLDSEYFISPAFRTVTPPAVRSLVFRDDFDTKPVFSDRSPDWLTGTLRQWRQNDTWQDSKKGYIDFTGSNGNWNANNYEPINKSGGGTQILDPFSVSAGVLTITNDAVPANLSADITAKAIAQGQSSSAVPRYGGYMLTDGGFTNPLTGQPTQFRGGYFEWRVKLRNLGPAANARGLFPAIWLYSTAGGNDPKGQGEIDVGEEFGKLNATTVDRTLHLMNGAGVQVYPDVAVGTTTSFDWSQWHTLALDWKLATDPGGPSLAFLIDGATVNTITGANAQWFDVPMSIRVNFSANANFFANPAERTDGSTTTPAYLDVDWIAAWTQGAVVATPTTGNSKCSKTRTRRSQLCSRTRTRR